MLPQKNVPTAQCKTLFVFDQCLHFISAILCGNFRES